MQASHGLAIVIGALAGVSGTVLVRKYRREVMDELRAIHATLRKLVNGKDE